LLILFALAPRTSDARISGQRRTLLAGSQTPPDVRSVLERACQNCHSENTVWPWYANLPLLSQQIHGDVDRGRSFMNFSKWDDYSELERRGYLLAIVAATESHLMPPPKYSWIHREARLSDAELRLLRSWATHESRDPVPKGARF
jgi:heme-binding protein